MHCFRAPALYCYLLIQHECGRYVPRERGKGREQNPRPPFSSNKVIYGRVDHLVIWTLALRRRLSTQSCQSYSQWTSRASIRPITRRSMAVTVGYRYPFSTPADQEYQARGRTRLTCRFLMRKPSVTISIPKVPQTTNVSASHAFNRGRSSGTQSRWWCRPQGRQQKQSTRRDTTLGINLVCAWRHQTHSKSESSPARYTGPLSNLVGRSPHHEAAAPEPGCADIKQIRRRDGCIEVVDEHVVGNNKRLRLRALPQICRSGTLIFSVR